MKREIKFELDRINDLVKFWPTMTEDQKRNEAEGLYKVKRDAREWQNFEASMLIPERSKPK